MTNEGILEARLDKDAVRGVYTVIAPIYDFWALLTEVRARRRALELLAVRDGESVLEVAVGTGLTFVEILRANPSGRSEGIDLTPAMLERARRRVARDVPSARCELSLGDAYQLPFAAEQFDAVYNAYMFDLLPQEDFARVLSEMRRVLKPGGRLVLTNMSKSDRWYGELPELLYKVSPRLMGGCRGVVMAPFVEAAGFRDIMRETVIQAGFPSEVIAARRSP
jgi:ubiquinone/menaquinone biosynthesis C-methylase UbiE